MEVFAGSVDVLEEEVDGEGEGVRGESRVGVRQGRAARGAAVVRAGLGLCETELCELRLLELYVLKNRDRGGRVAVRAAAGGPSRESHGPFPMLRGKNPRVSLKSPDDGTSLKRSGRVYFPAGKQTSDESRDSTM
jgi:hypothetical protein